MMQGRTVIKISDFSLKSCIKICCILPKSGVCGAPDTVDIRKINMRSSILVMISLVKFYTSSNIFCYCQYLLLVVNQYQIRSDDSAKNVVIEQNAVQYLGMWLRNLAETKCGSFPPVSTKT